MVNDATLKLLLELEVLASPAPVRGKDAGSFSDPTLYDAKGHLIAEFSSAIGQPAEDNQHLFALMRNNIKPLVEEIYQLRAYAQEVHDSLVGSEETSDEKLQTMMKSPVSLVSTVATMAYKARLLLRGEQP